MHNLTHFHKKAQLTKSWALHNFFYSYRFDSFSALSKANGSCKFIFLFCIRPTKYIFYNRAIVLIFVA